MYPPVRAGKEAAAAATAAAAAALGGADLPGRGEGTETLEGRGYRRYSHPSGEVLATSAREYLALPAGARISVKFEVVSVGDGGSGRVVGGTAPGAKVTGGVAGAAACIAGHPGAAEEGGMDAGGLKGEEKSSAGFCRPQGFLDIQKL